MKQLSRGDVIIALDFPSADEVYAFLDRFEEEKPFVKIGMVVTAALSAEIRDRTPQDRAGHFQGIRMIRPVN